MGHSDHQDSQHQGSLTPHTPGPRPGWNPELGSVAQAEYATGIEQEAAAAAKSRGSRVRRLLRRIFWEF